MTLFDRPKTMLTIVGALVLAIVLLIVIERATSDRTEAPNSGDPERGRCAVAQQALDAFDQGRPPPAEWIQDRAAAAEAVRTCGKP